MVSQGIFGVGRTVVVWVSVTAAAAISAGAAPSAWRAARTVAGPEVVAHLLVAACATASALALAWLWVITTLTVAGLLTGRTRGPGGATRRLVLVACGVAVLAGTSIPAHATDERERLVGLALPERAVAPAARTAPGPVERHTGTHADPDAYVVRPGDSLWSIARQHPGDADSVELRWRAIWRANRAVIGDDPDLILPGQALSLPRSNTPHPDPHRDQDGDR